MAQWLKVWGVEAVEQMQKTLTEMNVQLADVIGMAILRPIVAGERGAISRLQTYRVRASRQEIARSLEGNWRQESKKWIPVKAL
ncbi:MAG: hypothetical protein WA324_03985 [Bryobacteraceae bacterium]